MSNQRRPRFAFGMMATPRTRAVYARTFPESPSARYTAPPETSRRGKGTLTVELP